MKRLAVTALSPQRMFNTWIANISVAVLRSLPGMSPQKKVKKQALQPPKQLRPAGPSKPVVGLSNELLQKHVLPSAASSAAGKSSDKDSAGG